jgi:hypothetical protein
MKTAFLNDRQTATTYDALGITRDYLIREHGLTGKDADDAQKIIGALLDPTTYGLKIIAMTRDEAAAEGLIK